MKTNTQYRELSAWLELTEIQMFFFIFLDRHQRAKNSIDQCWPVTLEEEALAGRQQELFNIIQQRAGDPHNLTPPFAHMSPSYTCCNENIHLVIYHPLSKHTHISQITSFIEASAFKTNTEQIRALARRNQRQQQKTQ